MSFIVLLKRWKKQGFIKGLKQFYMMDTLKAGSLIGSDDMGNEYYEDMDEDWGMKYIVFLGRQRYVIYKNHDFNASEVPAKWLS